MLPIDELLFIVKEENIFDLAPFGPRIDEALFRSTEMILIVALTADEALRGETCDWLIIASLQEGYAAIISFARSATTGLEK